MDDGILADAGAQDLLSAQRAADEDQERSSLQAVMATPEGRRVLWGLILDAGTFGPSFTADAQVTAFNEGQRHRGLALMFRLQRETPELYVQALQEDMARQSARATTQQAAEAAVEREDAHG